MSSAFGSTLREHLKKANMTQLQFAAELGLSRGAVAQFVVGLTKPPRQRIAKMAEVLGLSGADKTRFEIEAHLSHMPEDVEAETRRLLGW